MRQLLPQELTQLGFLALLAGLHDGGRRLQRLQQILDVVGDARTGLVDSLQACVASELLLALLAAVEMGDQLEQQLCVPAKRGADAPMRVHGNLQIFLSEVKEVACLIATLALGPVARPGDARDPGQLDELRDGRLEKPIRRPLAERDVGEAPEPALEGRADVLQIALPELAEAAEACQRRPQPADGEQEQRNGEDRLDHRHRVVGSGDVHAEQASHGEDAGEQRHRQSVEKIDGLFRIQRFFGIGHEEQNQGHDQQPVTEHVPGFASRELQGDHRGNAGDENLGDEKHERHEIGVTAAPSRRHASAGDGREDQQPEGHQPPVHPDDEHQGRGDEDDGALPVEPLLAPPQRLPHEEQAKVGEHHAARKRAPEIPPQRQVQAGKHQRQNLVLETPVDQKIGAGHGRAIPVGCKASLEMLTSPCRIVY